MGQVMWINGTFGVGKTTVAQLLAQSLDSAFILDPEVIGETLGKHLVPPSLRPGDFQDIRLWRTFTRDAVCDAAVRFDGVVIVPMTIANFDYFDEVVGAISRAVRLDHFTLMASRETILRRERERPDDQSAWVEQAADRILPALADRRFSRHIDTEKLPADVVAQDILSQSAL
jgi:chloramphenicol 3-O-phosphotransferase